jgi:threonine synthase
VSGLPSSLTCAGCGWTARDDEPFPFRCARHADPALPDVDHVLRRTLDLARVAWPADSDPNPFVRYRSLFHAYHLAVAGGTSDAEFVELVRALDQAVAGVDGRGFSETPFAAADELAERVGMRKGALWVKDETGNVSGSHKARHLFGLLVHLEVVERLGLASDADRPPLAIASCGNAALAAAVVANAGGRRLEVFVPTDADPEVLARLKELDADVVVCPRDPAVPGDPTYNRLEQAIAAGALPFTTQGNQNGLCIEGGLTMAYEMADALAAGGSTIEHVVVQVGGGALASGVIQGLREARELDALGSVPTIHAVQTQGAFPLPRAFDLVRSRAARTSAEEALAYSIRHRSEFMWPWEEPPRSIAHGILDDETYDWAAVVGGLLATTGSTVVVDEATLEEANRLGTEATGIPADHTGTSGLAGLLALRRAGGIGDAESTAVLFTGIRRWEDREERKGSR